MSYDASRSGAEMNVSGLVAGRRVLVTGALGDIGAAVRAEFEAAGASVVAADVQPADGVLLCDVTDEASTAAAFDAAQADGPVTDVVHAAGVGSVGPVKELDLGEWERVVAVNLTGSFLVARECARRLERGGTLTLVSSQAGLRGGANWSAYCASKFGVIGLMQCLAQELAPVGVRVNAVCPGAVDSVMTRELVARLAKLEGVAPEAVRGRYERGCPMGRYADPSEVARVCLFLASELASYMSGSSVVVDGAELSA
jgi:NAD(P)-dependent dehydrogenase (short-subunit alcohol dehydrogenase family)